MKRLSMLIAVLFLAGTFAGCFVMQHTVGRGPQGRGRVEKRVWYCIWGLVPLGDHPDSKQLAGGATDYRVTTEATALDVIIGIFTQAVTIQPRTIIVEK